MDILSWFWAIAGALGALYAATQISTAVPASFALVGWGMLLIWLVVAVVYRQKFIEVNKLVIKARKQNAEFIAGLINILQLKVEETQQLRKERSFLMMAIENYGKEEDNDKTKKLLA
jgi:hypothetical protein